MNERIEQLADQCMTERQDSNGVYVEYFDHKKFAELLAQDAISIVQSFRCKMDASNDNIVEALKQHFGVE